MVKKTLLILFGLFPLLPTVYAVAAEKRPIPRDWQAMTRRVDELLAERWQKEKVEPARRTTDAEFMRRVYLDLTGRIPRVSEVRAFLKDNDPQCRTKLIDRLLGTDLLAPKPDHPTHLAVTWQRFLLPAETNPFRTRSNQTFENWLRTKFADNEPYDKIVSELLLAEGRSSQSSEVLYYTQLKLNPEKLAAATSRAFLGVQIECAQCHDHPFDNWTQKDFWGYAAFFARIQTPTSRNRFFAMVQDFEEGEVKLPDTETIVKPHFLNGVEAIDRVEVTRREQLAEWLTSGDNPYFARAAVNRVWAHLFGRGIVDPVDDFGQHNLPSHPELLDELVDYFVQNGFNIRDLMRLLVNTEAYQLSSTSVAGDDARPELFARMAIKTLSAEQLYDCLELAIAKRPVDLRRYGQRRGVSRSSIQNRMDFLNKFRVPANSATKYEAGIPQALTFMNGNLIKEAVDLQKSDILVALEAPFFTEKQRIETLFLSTLSRLPSKAEQTKFAALLSSPGTENKKREAYSNMLWALLNSAEFTFNH